MKQNKIDRSEWLLEMRREIEAKYDKIWAPLYGEKWGLYPNATHQRFIRELLDRLAPHSKILDAACGAGRYMGMILEQGHHVFGIDQSQGMLERARLKFPSVRLEKVGLQEMSFNEAFEGAICIDALEHIFPEDWLPVLYNFQRALKLQACLYLTVEVADPDEIEAAFLRGQMQGLPVVFGEWINDDVYHYYPRIEQVREWMGMTGFVLLEEGLGDGYHHFLICKP